MRIVPGDGDDSMPKKRPVRAYANPSGGVDRRRPGEIYRTQANPASALLSGDRKGFKVGRHSLP